MTQSPPPEKVLFLSDIHVGAETSNFPAYQANMLERMTHYDHVVMIGDCWELFYIGKNHVKALSQLLSTLTDQDSGHFANEFSTTGTARSGVENVINGAKLFTAEFLERNPKTHLHFVGGNHESMRKFHNEFDELQRHFPNFEWSPEGIRIGDVLATHGHLPMYGKTLDKFPIARLRDADKSARWTDLVYYFSPTEHRITGHKAKERASLLIENKLTNWEKKGEFIVSHNGVRAPLDMKWVKQVVFGHTHFKFDNYTPKGSDITFHNTGAIVQLTSQKPEDTGVLEGELNADGTVTNIRPVPLNKDKKIFRVGGSRDESPAR